MLLLVVLKADDGDGASSPSGELVSAASSHGGLRRRRAAGVAAIAEFPQGLGCSFIVPRGFLCNLFGPVCPSGLFCILCTCTVLWSYLI